MKLVVSLPQNSVEMALAAESAGADAVKLHMNVEHRASSTLFGNYSEEFAAVNEILDAVDIEVGLMPGADQSSLPSFDELSALAHAGLAFVDIYAHHMPLWFIDLPLDLIVAIDSFTGFVEEPFYLSHLYWPPQTPTTRISMLEASIAAPEDYGKPFSYIDLRRLRILQEYADAPLLVPTQKAITPEDAVWLARSGTGGLMIGAVVTGVTVESLAEATEKYRKAIDSAGT